MTKLDQFLSACLDALGRENVLSGSEASAYQKNTSGFTRKIGGVVFPASTSQVRKVIFLANRYLVSVHPISTGKNWGLGSKLPVRDGAVIVDLKKLNRIRFVDNKHGFAVIEPGVTQRQLAVFLRAQAIPFFLDVTGSGEDTSVLGNALERGVAYNSLRVETLANLEVVLGTGEVIKTGFGHLDQVKSSYIYKYGVGPWLDGLFSQSNLGIVTAAAIRLLPTAECTEAVVFKIKDDGSLKKALPVIGNLIRTGILNSVVHVGNRARTVATTASLMANSLNARTEEDKKAIERFVLNVTPSDWSGVGSIRGNFKQVSTAKKIIGESLDRVCEIGIVSERRLKIAKRLLGLLGSLNWTRQRLAYINAIHPLLGLTRGIPTNAALHSVHWAAGEAEQNNPDLDQSSSGILYCLPIIPNDPGSIHESLEITKRVLGGKNFEPYITLNTINSEALEGVINVCFNRADKRRARLAKEAILELQLALIRNGFALHRLSIDSMGHAVKENDYWKVVRRLKTVFDPNNIISPGRYNLV